MTTTSRLLLSVNIPRKYYELVALPDKVAERRGKEDIFACGVCEEMPTVICADSLSGALPTLCLNASERGNGTYQDERE